MVTSFAHYIFKIKTTECTFNDSDCPAEIAKIISSLENKNVLGINQKKVSETVSKSRPITNLSIHFKLFNKLKVEIKSTVSSIPITIYLIQKYPELSLNAISESSTSAAYFIKPSDEMDDFIKDTKYDSYSMWPDGNLAPIATSESQIILLVTSKPDNALIKQIYEAVSLFGKYLSFEKIYIIDHDIFLSRLNQPDIIITVPYDERTILEALQSLGFLSTIKKDNKVIDLRYKNPVIR